MEYTLSEAVTFSFSVPEGVDANKAAIYLMADDGTVTRMTVTIVDDSLIFQTTDVGLFVVGESLTDEDLPTETTLITVSQPFTEKELPVVPDEPSEKSYIGIVVLAALLTVAIASAIVLMYYKKRKDILTRQGGSNS